MEFSETLKYLKIINYFIFILLKYNKVKEKSLNLSVIFKLLNIFPKERNGI